MVSASATTTGKPQSGFSTRCGRACPRTRPTSAAGTAISLSTTTALWHRPITIPSASRRRSIRGCPAAVVTDLRVLRHQSRAVRPRRQLRDVRQNYGEISDVYDGIDLTLNARLPRGAIVQGGLNIGREVTDLCDVVAKVDLPAAPLPFSTSDLASALIPSLSGLPSPSTNFCRVSPPFQTELKLSASYPLPWDVQMSATIQSIPGTPIVATAVVPNSQIVPSLGRDLAAGEPGQRRSNWSSLARCTATG